MKHSFTCNRRNDARIWLQPIGAQLRAGETPPPPSNRLLTVDYANAEVADVIPRHRLAKRRERGSKSGVKAW